MLKCNQICQWNYSCIGIGCKKPDDKLCPIYNVESQQKPMTKADRIRAMTDDELAWELMTWRIETEAKHQGVESSYPNTQAKILEWLQQPEEGDA